MSVCECKNGCWIRDAVSQHLARLQQPGGIATQISELEQAKSVLNSPLVSICADEKIHRYLNDFRQILEMYASDSQPDSASLEQEL